MRQPNAALRRFTLRQLGRSAAWVVHEGPVMKLLAGIVAACLLTAAAAIAAEEPGTLRAGAAKTDITPAKPVTMAGYAAAEDLSQGVHDPLSARAIAFEQDGKRLVLVSADLIGFRGEVCDGIRKSILTTCQLQPAELFLAAIHTHGGPNPTLDSSRGHANNVEYTKRLDTQLVELVKGRWRTWFRLKSGSGPARLRSASTGAKP